MTKQKIETSELPNGNTYFVQKINANNDKNGNPDRIFHIYDAGVKFIGWIEDGYAGTNFYQGNKINELNTIHVSKTKPYKYGTEYKNKGGN